MATATIPVDLFNPGQVFACLGLLELAEALIGGAEGGFDWSDSSDARFAVSAPGQDDPISAGLDFLAGAKVEALAPPGLDLDTKKWQIPCRTVAFGDDFPIPPPVSPASLPAVLSAGGRAVVVHSWGDGNVRDAHGNPLLGTRRDNVKFWGGSGGYPGAGLFRDALEAASPSWEGARPHPFAVSAPQSSSFRFDWRRDYIPIDAGFSPNEHGRMQPRGYPLVEVLAAVGLSHARPHRLKKLEYRYGVAGRADPGQPESAALLPPPFLRAALGVAALPFPTRTFTMHLNWPGQEGQARCITTVVEETA